MANQPTRRIAASLVAVVCAFFAADNTLAQCQYHVTAIIKPEENCWPLPDSIVVGRGMNAHGEVAGHYVPCAFGNERAFFWSQRTGFITLPTPPSVVQAYANDVNDSRQIVGRHLINGVGWTGFVYDPKTQGYTYLQPLYDGHGTVQTVSTVNAINNAGIAVGTRLISKPGVTPPVTNAVIWDTNTGEVIDLGVGEGPRSEAMDISESGEYVVGWANGTGPLFGQAAIWTNGKLEVIGPLPGTDNSIVNAVNESGVAVGSGLHQTIGWRAFIWDGAFTIIDGTDGWQAARGRAINNLGQALFNFSQLQQGHTPLLWQHGELHYLQPLLVSDQQNHSLSWAVGTNDHGQLLCITSSNYAVVLSPADRPLTDLNADCRTDVHDLLILLDAWGRVPRSAKVPADLNGDGVVDVSDLLILLANWTMP